MDRRTMLTMLSLASVAGCAPVAPPAVPGDRRLADLERTFHARLGLYAWDTGSGRQTLHRADERFAFCSTFKALAVAALLRNRPLSDLDRHIRFAESDLLASSVITRHRVVTGMTLREVCDAAVRFSDGTAGNLLLRELGGPGAVTDFARSIGDDVTRMDRVEPDIVTAEPHDPRDTSSPRALGGAFAQVLLGRVLPEDRQSFLLDLLVRNTTGTRRIRAGLPANWLVADKTGTGNYGTINDLAVVWPPRRSPIVIALMSSRQEPDAASDESLLAETAAYVVEVFS